MYIKEMHVDGMNQLIGAELVAIDGKPLTEIIRELKDIQPRDGLHESFVDYSMFLPLGTTLYVCGMVISYYLTT